MTGRLLCVGSYTSEAGGNGTGITTFQLDERTDTLTPGPALELPAPSWLEWHPTRPILYAANELDIGTVTAIAARGSELQVMGQHPTGGAAPCHLAVTPTGRHLLAANYTGGSVAVFALHPDGRIARRTDLVRHTGSGPHLERQDAPHPHMVVLDHSGTLVSIVDLGTDKIHSYRLAGDGRLTAVGVSPLPAGAGPRQLVRAHTSTRGYVLGELSPTLYTVEEASPGRFTVVASTPASGRSTRNLPAQLTLSTDGRFAYVSNRVADSISVFALDGDRPALVDEYPVGTGWPRHFALVGRYLVVANQHGDELVLFAVDAVTGALTERRRQPARTPTCIAIGHVGATIRALDRR